MSDPLLEADLILLHPPSVYDFRERRDVLFAYLGNSDSVAASAMYEIYPLGFKSLETYLSHRGFKVRIVNLAALLLSKFDLDVPRFLARLRARVFGIDLHWICHAHGGLALAGLLKEIHPRTPVLFGGITATLYREELMGYDPVDMVMEGYDTLEPVHQLMLALSGKLRIEDVPNLSWKRDGEIVVNAYEHAPRSLPLDCAADWRPFLASREKTSPSLMFLPSSGCAYNCGWCGGSREAVRRIFRTRHTVAAKRPETVLSEIESMAGSPAVRRANIYTINAYNFGPEALDAYLKGLSKAGIAHASYEQFHLTRPETLRKMVAAAKTTIHISPESHDPTVSRLAGRGVYSMEEMEDWIQEALSIGVYGVHVWFFIGMPRQTPSSVFDTVEYARHLMERFRGRRVFPLLCPMVPFLDPGSTFFEEPQEHGYRIFFRSLEDHRRALVAPSWMQRLNYETVWMSRTEIVEVSYDAVAALTRAKKSAGVLPGTVADFVLGRLAEAKDLVFEVDRVHAQEGVGGVAARLGDRILEYNTRILRGGVSDQIFPIPRQLDNRWFDEFEVALDGSGDPARPC
ncbi:MAG: cobalamin B12-binding domain-containing protein [Planctomycetes bacterium]|nr:cobalamin B12-binding domain-containing protein [Planctomycetota bacterium]